jgi:Protein of unknown function (DUF2877)
LSGVTITHAPVLTTAAAPERVLELIKGPLRQASRIAAFPSAVYVRLSTGALIALLSRDAVRMPFGLVLAKSSAEVPLDRLRGRVLTGASGVWIGQSQFRITRLVPQTAPRGLVPDSAAVEHACLALPALRAVVPNRAGSGGASWLAEIVRLDSGDALRVLGRGPGLTPSGDDLLAGLLVGAWSFGLPADPLRAVVRSHAPSLTTEVSAALLGCACRGESIPELTAMVLALTRSPAEVDSALDVLAAIGHTSGRALAAGVIAAAKIATAPPIRSYPL